MKKNVLSGITAMLCSLLCLPSIYTAVPCAFAAEETAYTTTFPTQTTAFTSTTTTTTSAEYLTKGTIPLTLDDVIALSKKGGRTWLGRFQGLYQYRYRFRSLY